MEIIGYDQEKINQLEELDANEFEPVEVNSFVQKVICVCAMVHEQKSFDEIREELDCSEMVLKQLFQFTPSLPRPYDIHKYL